MKKSSLIIFIFVFIQFSLNESQILKGTAQLTYYHSYASCCPNNPNYDPLAITEECDLYAAW